MSSETDGARRPRRVDATFKVDLKYPDRDTFIERFAVNISRTGIFVRSRDPVPVGSRVHFEYRLADQSRALRGIGVVRWIRTAADAKEPDQPPGMGIEFVDLDPVSDELVAKIVSAHGEGSRAPQRATTPAPSAAPAAPRIATPAPPARRNTSPFATGDAKLDAAEESAIDSLWGEPSAPAAAPAPAPEPEPPALEPEPRPATHPAGGTEAPSRRAESVTAAKPSVDAELDALLGDLDTGVPAQAPSGDATKALFASLAAKKPSATAPATAPAPAPATAPATATATAMEAAPPAPVRPERGAEAPSRRAESALIADVLVIDLCAADIMTAMLVREGDRLDRLAEDKVVARVTSQDGVPTLDKHGAWLPQLFSWHSAEWPSPRGLALARRLGFSMGLGPTGLPTASTPDGPVDLDAVAQVLLHRVFALYHGRGAKVPRLVAIAPANIAMETRVLVEGAMAEAGLGQPELWADAHAVLDAVELTPAAEDYTLVVQVGALETRLALLGGLNVVATRSLIDVSFWEADHALVGRAKHLMLKQDHVDVEDDPALEQMVVDQVRDLRRQQVGDTPWELAIGESNVVLEPKQIVTLTYPVSERLALGAHGMLSERGLAPSQIRHSVFTTDEMPWPGLVDVFTQLTGLSPILPDAGPWLRIDGASRRVRG